MYIMLMFIAGIPLKNATTNCFPYLLVITPKDPDDFAPYYIYTKEDKLLDGYQSIRQFKRTTEAPTNDHHFGCRTSCGYISFPCRASLV